MPEPESFQRPVETQSSQTQSPDSQVESRAEDHEAGIDEITRQHVTETIDTFVTQRDHVAQRLRAAGRDPNLPLTQEQLELTSATAFNTVAEQTLRQLNPAAAETQAVMNAMLREVQFLAAKAADAVSQYVGSTSGATLMNQEAMLADLDAMLDDKPTTGIIGSMRTAMNQSLNRVWSMFRGSATAVEPANVLDRRTTEVDSGEYATLIMEIMRHLFELRYRMTLAEGQSLADARSWWNNIRVSLSATTILPITLLKTTRNISMRESFTVLQQVWFWLDRISREGVKDRHGTRDREPTDVSLQSDAASHTDEKFVSIAGREALRQLSVEEQMATRIAATLTTYSQPALQEDFMLVEQDRTGQQSARIELSLEYGGKLYFLAIPVTEVVGESASVQNLLHKLTGVIRAIRSGSQAAPETWQLSPQAQRLLQTHAYQGRHALDRVDQALLNCDVRFNLQTWDEHTQANIALQRSLNVTGGSMSKESIHMLFRDGVISTDMTRMSHTWLQGRDGGQKHEHELMLMARLAELYAHDRQTSSSESSNDLTTTDGWQWRGITAGELTPIVQQMRAKAVTPEDRQRAAQWANELQQPTEKLATANLPQEWLSEYTFSRTQIDDWNRRIGEVVKRGEVSLSLADCLNQAIMLGMDISAIQTVVARKVRIGERDKEVLDIVADISGPVLKRAYQTGDLQAGHEYLLRSQKAYTRAKRLAKQGRGMTSAMAVLTGGKIGTYDLQSVVSSVSSMSFLAGERLVEMVQGEGGMVSVLFGGRPWSEDRVAQQASEDQRYAIGQGRFFSANSDAYRPETLVQAQQRNHVGAIGVQERCRMGDNGVESVGLVMTQRLTVDQAYRHITESVARSSWPVVHTYQKEILIALQDAVSPENTYAPMQFAESLLSHNVARSHVNEIIRFIDGEVRALQERRSQEVAAAMEWVIRAFEATAV